MQSKNHISLLNKTLYGIMLLGILLSPLGTGITPVAHAQDETPEALTPTSEPPACYTLDLVVAAGEGTIEALTPQNCEGGYLPGTVIELVANASNGFIISKWNGTINDESIEDRNSTQATTHKNVSVSFSPEIEATASNCSNTITINEHNAVGECLVSAGRTITLDPGTYLGDAYQDNFFLFFRVEGDTSVNYDVRRNVIGNGNLLYDFYSDTHLSDNGLASGEKTYSINLGSWLSIFGAIS